jgi:dihydrofolate reductase
MENCKRGDQMKIISLVCTDKNMGIGYQNQLPWHNKEDMRFFRSQTLCHTVLMGRKTFESVGKLPDRLNIVVTSTLDLSDDDLFTCTNICKGIRLAKARNTHKLFIIGGAQIYKEGFQYSDEIIMTQLDGGYTCDTYCPPIPPQFKCVDWEQLSGADRLTYYRCE